MSEFDINKAARIVRAGNEFSATNKKLQEAVWSFIGWFYLHTGEYQAPEEIGWSIKKVPGRESYIRLSFEREKGGWFSVTAHLDEGMNPIIECCRALAGKEGERLLEWLKKETMMRSELFTAIQTAANLQPQTF